MRPSYIATIDPAAIPEDGPSGWVVLGTIDGLAYVHFAPYAGPVTWVFPNGDLTNPQPDGDGLVGIVESPRPDWADDATIVYDPQPAPFRWDAFAAAHPDLAETLTPHQWAGE